jgi:hypothetical protein
VVLQRNYRSEQPVGCHRPAELAAALSRAFEEISATFQADLYPRLASDLAAK